MCVFVRLGKPAVKLKAVDLLEMGEPAVGNGINMRAFVLLPRPVHLINESLT